MKTIEIDWVWAITIGLCGTLGVGSLFYSLYQSDIAGYIGMILGFIFGFIIVIRNGEK